jgi:hypothetical protein
VRYADDSNVYVSSERAGKRVPDARNQHGAESEGTLYVPARRARLLRLLPDTLDLESLDQWLRRRLRSVLWKQWKRGRTRFAELRKQNIGPALAAKTAGGAHGPWHLANSWALTIALPNSYFDLLGLTR